MTLVAAEQRTPRWAWAVALVLTLAAFVLRVWPIHTSLWIDELHTAWCAEGALSEVAERAAIGNQSPLFFWFEWILIRVFGPSEISLRLPSLVAGSLLPLATFWLASRWNLVGAGLLAAFLVTIDQPALFYAGEGRPYAAVQLLTVVHLAILLELVDRPSLSLRIAWIATAAILFHLHYAAALLFPAEVVFFALVALTRPQLTQLKWTTFAVDWLAATVLCLPAAGNVWSILGRRTNWTFVEREPLWILFDWWPGALGLWFIAAALVIQRFSRIVTAESALAMDRRWFFGWLCLCWLLVPASIAWSVTAADFTRLFFPRYLTFVVPAAALVAAGCVALAPWWWSRILLVVLIGAVGFGASGIVEDFRKQGGLSDSRGEDWRGCVTWLNKQLEQEPFPVLVWSGLIEANALREPHNELLEDYLLLPVLSLYPISADRGDLFPLPLDEPIQLPQPAEMLAVHRAGAWLIVRGKPELARQIADSLTEQLQSSNSAGLAVSWKADKPQSFGKVQAVRLTMLEQSKN